MVDRFRYRPARVRAIRVDEMLRRIESTTLPVWAAKLWRTRIDYASPTDHTTLAFSDGESWRWASGQDWIVLGPGDHRLRRFSSDAFDETFQPAGWRSRRKRCSRCDTPGHTRTTCENDPLPPEYWASKGCA